MKDHLPAGVEYELDNGKKAMVTTINIRVQNSKERKQTREKLTQTANLAKKLVTAEPVPQG